MRAKRLSAGPPTDCLTLQAPPDGLALQLERRCPRGRQHTHVRAYALHDREAQASIKFLLKPATGAGVSDYVGYANPNLKAGELMDQGIGHDDAVYPPQAVLDKLFISAERPGKVQRLMTQSWTKVKSGQ